MGKPPIAEREHTTDAEDGRCHACGREATPVVKLSHNRKAGTCATIRECPNGHRWSITSKYLQF
jgi:hypothetical protein